MAIWIDTDKSSEKANIHSDKIPQQRTEGNFLNLIKGIYKISTNMINGERLNVFPLRLGIKQRASAFTTTIQYCTGYFMSKIREGKGRKKLKDWRRSKTAFIHMIIYIENLMKSRKKAIRTNKQV